MDSLLIAFELVRVKKCFSLGGCAKKDLQVFLGHAV